MDDADEIAARMQKAIIKRYAMGPKIDYHQPESSLKCTKILESCICDECSEIKLKIPLKPRRHDPRLVTPSRGPLDTVMCSPAPYIQRKVRKWKPRNFSAATLRKSFRGPLSLLGF